MGLNISLYKVKNVKKHKFESDDRFDSTRHVGDRHFGVDVDWKSIHCGNTYCCDWIFRRPENFGKAKMWVRKNVPQGNQKRLMGVLDLLQKEKDLYLFFGY